MNKQTDVNQMVQEARVRKDGEEAARHVMGAVPVILLADLTVVVTVICLAAVLFTVLFRGGG